VSSRKFMRAFGALGVLGLLAATFTGCSSADDANGGPPGTLTAGESPSPGGHLVYGLEADPNGLDPTRNAFDRAGLMLANALYDPVAAFDSAGNVKPYLIERFETNADYTEWRFHLRPNVFFHSGARLDADAILNFAQAIRDSAITGPVAKYVKDLTKVDDLTGLLTMNKSWATFPVILTGQGGYVVSPQQLKDPQGQIHPDGTGPFRLNKWEQNKRFELTRNPTYWQQGLPYLDALDFEVIPDGGERLARLRSGYLDVVSVNHLDEIRALNAAVDEQRGSSRGERIDVERDTGTSEDNFVLLNTAVAPLDDLRVRRAIAFATDRNALARQNGWDAADLLDGPFPRDSPWYSPADWPGYDLDKARQLVKEYEADQRRKGRDPKIKFKILGSYDMPALQQLIGQWASAGITTTIEQIDFKRHIVLAVAGGYDTEFLRYFGMVDPDSLWHFFSSDTYADVGKISLNIGRFRDAQIDRAIDAGRATLDPARRKEAYAAFQRRLAEVSTHIFLARSPWYIATSRKTRDARNVKLPDGSPALPFLTGTHRLTETWISK
jgi:peptide/nickel transport system substrate-binding protein